MMKKYLKSYYISTLILLKLSGINMERTILKLKNIISLAIVLSNVAVAEDFEDYKINSSHGRILVEQLKNSIAKKSTTSLRREQKTVTFATHLHERLQWLQDPFKKIRILKKNKIMAVVFSTRDHAQNGYKNITYTFYGKGAYFWNLGIKTKIKLRARFYLQENIANGSYERAKALESLSFLELKVKNPSPEELNSVNKYRVKIEDRDLLELINTEKEKTSEVLAKIKNNTLNKVQGKKTEMIETMFLVIKDLATEDNKFIEPQLAISYERTAKKFLEEKYKSKKGLLKRKFYKDMEYQLTLDQNIKGYKLSRGFMDNSSNFLEFFQNNKNNFLYQYPHDSVVVEIKVPLSVANLNPKEYSPIHRRIHDEFINSVFTQEALYPGFRLNKGKAGHLKRILAQKGEK